ATGANTASDAEALTPVPEIVATSGNGQPDNLIAAADPGSARPGGLIGADVAKEPAKTPTTGAAKAASASDAVVADAPVAVPAAPKKSGGIQVIALPPAPEPLPKLTVPQNADPERLAKLLAE